MASCRITPTNPAISSYDSAGGKDYSDLSTWEAATDTDRVAATAGAVLEVYAGAHDDSVFVSGATTNALYYRQFRAAAGEGHSGKPVIDGSVAALVVTVSTRPIQVASNESYFAVQDIVFSSTFTDAGSGSPIWAEGPYPRIIGCLVESVTNNGTGGAYGFYISPVSGSAYVVNCLVHDVTSTPGESQDGIRFTLNGGTLYGYNLVSYDNGRFGFYATTNTTVVVKNCIAGNNANNWYESSGASFTKTTCLDDDSDTLSFMDASNGDFRPKNDFSDAIQVGTDLSADGIFPFDDDLADVRTPQGGTQAGFPRYSTKWTIGALEYWYQQKRNGQQGRKIGVVEPYDIKSRNGIENT